MDRLSNLPDELLLLISAQFTDTNRNKNLASLCLVSRSFRPIAQEWLLCRPRFNLTYIDAYMLSIARYPHLLPRIHSLEVWSTSAGRLEFNEYGYSKKLYRPIRCPTQLAMRYEFMERCRRIVHYYAREPGERMQWLLALEEDVVAGLFGVLLCILPELRELKLGGGWLMDFPVLSNMLAEGPTGLLLQPTEWKKGFLANTLAVVAPRLEVLEMPANMSALWFFTHVNSVFDFRRFGALKEIGVTMRALANGGFHPFNPREVFPPSLEILRISEATYDTMNLVRELCLLKHTSFLPVLRRIEIYYMNSVQQVGRMAFARRCPSPIRDAGIMCSFAKLRLQVYFPGHELQTWMISRTPWSLRGEGLEQLKEAERRFFNLPIADVWFPVLELEWDERGIPVSKQY